MAWAARRPKTNRYGWPIDHSGGGREQRQSMAESVERLLRLENDHQLILVGFCTLRATYVYLVPADSAGEPIKPKRAFEVGPATNVILSD
jgi:hypothetical protein